jgi:RimJ/RimL family protein N-acetyltransferase
MTLPIEAERLILRRFAEGDEPALIWLSSDPELHAAADELGSTTEEAGLYISAQQAFEPFEHGALFDLAIELRDGPKVVGLLTLVRRDTVGELGYALHAEARGRGVVTEAATALVDYAFRELALTEVFVETATTNLPARGVAERLGMLLDESPVVTREGEPGVNYRIDAAGWASRASVT